MTDVQSVQIGIAIAPAVMATIMSLIYVPQSRTFSRTLMVFAAGFLVALVMQQFVPPPEW